MNRRQLRERLAQSLVVGIPGPEAGAEELALVAEFGLGGVILFRRNLVSPRQVWELCHRLRRAAAEAGRPPLLVMVDQEGGSVVRLREPFTCAPDFCELGRQGREAVAAQGRRLGRELAAAGFNWNLAPVVDVHAIEGGVMARRSLGSDPRRVGELAAAFIRAQQEAGCLACAKHFPGLGRTTADTHRRRPRVELPRAELEAVELVPFRAAVEAGVAGVMVCHAVFTALDPERPASLSRVVVEGLLRGELGYRGVVLSDDLEMGAVAREMSPARAAVEAYRAGCDLLLLCSRAELALEALERLVELAAGGEIPPERVMATWSRLERLKGGLRALPGPWWELERLLRG